MKVMEIIDRLNRDYHPDTELYVEWWDKELAQSFSYLGDDAVLSDEEWAAAVDHLEEVERPDQSAIADAIGQAVDDVVNGKIVVQDLTS